MGSSIFYQQAGRQKTSIDTGDRFIEASIVKTTKYYPIAPKSRPKEGAREEGRADQNNNDNRITRLLNQYMPAKQPDHCDNAIMVDVFVVKLMSSQDVCSQKRDFINAKILNWKG